MAKDKWFYIGLGVLIGLVIEATATWLFLDHSKAVTTIVISIIFILPFTYFIHLIDKDRINWHVSKIQWYVVCGILSLVIIILSVFSWLFGQEEATWINMSGIAIGTFIFSLICMDYLTYKPKKEANSTSSGSQDNSLETITNEIAAIKMEVDNLKTVCSPKCFDFIYSPTLSEFSYNQASIRMRNTFSLHPSGSLDQKASSGV